MNETINNIMNRRSMRGFSNEMPTKEQLTDILNAGLRAPSAMNSQCNHITVITDDALISELNEGVVNKMDDAAKARMRERCGENISVFYGAPAIMLISSTYMHGDYSKLDVGIAVENICIAAQSLGLNSCIIGMVAMFLSTSDSEAFVNRLNLPEGQKPIIAVAIGKGCIDMATPPINDGRSNWL